jgi:hypothetical protein
LAGGTAIASARKYNTYRLAHRRGREAQAVEDLRGALLHRRHVKFVQPLVDLVEAAVVDPLALLSELVGLLLEPQSFGVARHHDLECRLGRGGHLADEVVHVEVVGDGHLPLADRAEQRGLAGAVEAEKAVAVAVVEHERGVPHEDGALEGEGEVVVMDIAHRRVGRQLTRHDHVAVPCAAQPPPAPPQPTRLEPTTGAPAPTPQAAPPCAGCGVCFVGKGQ